MQTKCSLCDQPVLRDLEICSKCNQERLAAASIDRIKSGKGFTMENIEKFSIPNWIRVQNELKGLDLGG